MNSRAQQRADEYAAQLGLQPVKLFAYLDDVVLVSARPLQNLFCASLQKNSATSADWSWSLRSCRSGVRPASGLRSPLCHTGSRMALSS